MHSKHLVIYISYEILSNSALEIRICICFIPETNIINLGFSSCVKNIKYYLKLVNDCKILFWYAHIRLKLYLYCTV